MTDLAYSATLLVALVLAGAAAVCGVALMLSGKRRLRPLITWTGAAATAFGAVSLLVHLRFGHGSGSPEPMKLAPFFAHHPAYAGIAGLVLVAAVLRILRVRSGRD